MNAGKRSTVKIMDDLTPLDLSRQRKYQIRKMRKKQCILCGKKAFRDTLFCLGHNKKRGIKEPGRNAHHYSKWR